MTTALQSRILRASLTSLHYGRLGTPPSHEPLLARSSYHHLRHSIRLASSSSLEPTEPVISHTTVNPPATTRPPPLTLPERLPDTPTLTHLLATGKAYLRFYKTGLKHLYLNTRLVYALRSGQDTPSLPADTPSADDAARPAPVPVAPLSAGTRAALLLRERWSHDMRRLPLFAVMFLVCGEFTPLVVLALPHAVPFTCRIPKQVAKLQRQAEERRRASFEALDTAAAAAPAGTEGGGEAVAVAARNVHVARTLNLVSSLWDRVGYVPAGLAGSRAQKRIAHLLVDDALLRQGGGVPALEADEVRLACMDRGVDVLDCSEGELREILGAWLRLAQSDSEEDQVQRVYKLLTTRPEEWPALEKR